MSHVIHVHFERAQQAPKVLVRLKALDPELRVSYGWGVSWYFEIDILTKLSVHTVREAPGVREAATVTNVEGTRTWAEP